jgi:hypothetical protein
VDSHDIHFIEGFRAIRTFSHPILHAILDTFFAKHVATSLERSVLEPIFADGTESELLYYAISIVK